MKNLMLIITFLLLIISCNQKPKETNKVEKKATELELKQLVSDSIIHEFINFQISLKNGYSKPYLISDGAEYYYDRDDSLEILKQDSLFKPEDFKFIFEQIKFSKKYRFKKEFFNNVILVSSDTLKSLRKPTSDNFWSLFHEKFNSNEYFDFSMPIFSQDKQIVIIRRGMHCGALCGFGGTYIYIKKKNKWKEIKILNQWIS